MDIGNYLMGDEGIGVHLINAIQATEIPENVEILDGGMGGFFLMEYFESYPFIILIDATMDNRPTGTTRLIEPKFAKDFPRAMSTHDIGLRDLVEGLAILEKLPKIHLFVVSIAEIQSQQIELSADIQAAIPELKKRIFDLIEEINKNILVES
jgi:hydrogenase maturation protease